MLDLRGTNSSSPERPAPAGVPSVGSTDVSFTPPPRRSSPVLDAGNSGPTAKNISGVAAVKNDPVILVVALVSIAIAGVAGLVGSYLTTQQQVKLDTANKRYEQLNSQLHTGDTGKNLELLQLTALQVDVLAASKAQTPWVSLLDALGGQIPGAIELKNASFDSTTKVLTLGGSGASYDDVAHVIAALEASTSFANATLQNAASSQVENVVRVDFSIIAHYVPTTPVVAATTTTQGATQ